MAFATWIDDVRLDSDIESGNRIGPWEVRLRCCHSRKYAVDNGVRFLELDFAKECQGVDYNNTHSLARLARDHAEAILVPSCTRLRWGNLIICPDRLLPSSRTEVMETTNLTLTKHTDR